MPIRMVIERDIGLIRTTASGRVTGPDLVEYYRRLRAHPDFRSTLNEIFDAGQVDSVDLTAEDVRHLSSITEEFTKRGVPVRSPSSRRATSSSACRACTKCCRSSRSTC